MTVPGALTRGLTGCLTIPAGRLPSETPCKLILFDNFPPVESNFISIFKRLSIDIITLGKRFLFTFVVGDFSFFFSID